jgi:release factor glutamine methyltransferase
VTLALEIAGAQVVATDLSPGALAVAGANARRHGARVAFAGADLALPLRLEAFDLALSNPPYVAGEEAPRLSPEVRDFEPALALFAPDGGLAVVDRLLVEGERLRPGAFLAVEIGDGQLAAVEARLSGRRLGLYEVRPDLAGKPRVVVLRRA